MTRDPEATADSFRDAVAWVESVHRNDPAGRLAIARSCGDPAALLDAMAVIHLALAQAATADVAAHLADVRSRIGHWVGQEPIA